MDSNTQWAFRGVWHSAGNVLSARRFVESYSWLCLFATAALLAFTSIAAIAQQPLPNPNLLLVQNNSPRAIARQSDGKLLVATDGVADLRYLGGGPDIDAANNPVGFTGTFINGLMRLNTDGTRDTTFTVDLPDDRNGTTNRGEIFDIKIFGNFAYVVGSFTSIGGFARAGLARIDLVRNIVDPAWDPNPIGRIAGQIAVSSIALDGAGNLYTFGSLYDVRGKFNVRMAKIPANSLGGVADPNFDGRQVVVNLADDISATVGVFAAPVANGALYVIGTKVNGGRRAIYKINALSGVQDTSWSAAAQAIDMFINGVTVNATGDLFIAGQSTGTSTLGQNFTSPYNLVKLSGTTGQVAPGWVGGLNPPVPVIGVVPTYGLRAHAGPSLDSAGNLFVLGGRFYSDTVTFSPFKYDAVTGLPVAGFNGLVVNGGNGFTGYTLATSEGVYLEGRGYYGAARAGAVIRLDATNGAMQSTFNVNLKTNGFISSSTKLDDGRVVMGGSFTEVNGVPMNNLIRFNTDGTFDPSFTGGPNGLVANVKHIAGKLYVSGGFTFSGTAPRQFLARYDATNGAIDTTWSPPIDGFARAITGDATSIYMVGGFYVVDGVVTRCLAKVSATTGQPDATWQPALAGMSFGSQCQRAIAKVGNYVYVGMPGTQNFSGAPRLVVNGQNRTLARIDATTGVADGGFDPNPNGPVSAMESDGTNIFVSGGFNTIGGVPTRLAKLSGASGTIDTAFVQPLTGIPSGPTWIRPTTAGIFLTGLELIGTNNQIRAYVWKIQSNGIRDAAWAPFFDFSDGQGFNAATELLSPSRVIVGGSFSEAGTTGQLRLGVAAFSVAPSASLTFNQVGRGTYVIGSNSAAGINVSCNDCAPGSTTYQFDQGSALTLTVRAAPGWTFAGWSGASGNATCSGRNACTFTINAASTVTATFTKVRDLIEE